jgi:hypothetical protein
MVITDPQRITSIILEEMRKQIRANGKLNKGLSEEEIQYTLTEKYKDYLSQESLLLLQIE